MSDVPCWSKLCDLASNPLVVGILGTLIGTLVGFFLKQLWEFFKRKIDSDRFRIRETNYAPLYQRGLGQSTLVGGCPHPYNVRRQLGSENRIGRGIMAVSLRPDCRGVAE